MSWSPCESATRSTFSSSPKNPNPGLSGAAVGAWIERLQTEHDNLRAALEWSLSRPHGAADESALRLAGALGRFWWIAGYFGEGSRWLTRALAAGDAEVDSAARMKALLSAGLASPRTTRLRDG